MSTVQFPSSGSISIGDNAFSGDTTLASLTTASSGLLRTSEVTLPNCITSVGANAFNNTGITSLTINTDSQLTSVGTNAFGAVTTLTYSKDSALPNNFFSAFNTLQTATLTGSNITSLPPTGNFVNSLTTLNLASTGITSIPNGEFDGKSSLSNVTFPNTGLTTIGDRAFKGTALTNANLPTSVTSIGASAFENASQLNSIGSSANGITSIGANAFKGTSLTKLEHTDQLKTIGDSAFEGITQFTNDSNPLNLPAVTSIGANAFKGTKISSVTLPESNFTTINDGVFAEATNLATVTKTSKITSVGADAFLNTKLTSFDATALKTIGDNAFKKTQSTSSTTNTFTLTGGDKITSIGASAFENAGLTSFPGASTEGGRAGNNDVLVSIGDSAFKNNNLTTFTAPATLTSIGASAFENNDSLTNVDLSRTSLTSLPDNLFKTASHSGGASGGPTRSKRSVRAGEQQPQPQPHGLDLKLPTTINQITGNTFANSNLKTLDLSQNTFNSPDFPAAAFMNCEDLTEVSLPKNITTVHSDTFQNTPKLSKITMPGSATRIEVNSRGEGSNPTTAGQLTEIVFNVQATSTTGKSFDTIDWQKVTNIMNIFANIESDKTSLLGKVWSIKFKEDLLASQPLGDYFWEIVDPSNSEDAKLNDNVKNATTTFHNANWTYKKITPDQSQRGEATPYATLVAENVNVFRGLEPNSTNSGLRTIGGIYSFGTPSGSSSTLHNTKVTINIY